MMHSHFYSILAHRHKEIQAENMLNVILYVLGTLYILFLQDLFTLWRRFDPFIGIHRVVLFVISIFDVCDHATHH